MYRSIVQKSFQTAELIVELRKLLQSLWPAFAVMWAMAMALLFYLYVSPHTPPSHVMIESMGIGMDKLCHFFVHAGLLAMPLALVPDKRLAWFMAWRSPSAWAGGNSPE